jgi:hypothetical protein
MPRKGGGVRWLSFDVTLYFMAPGGLGYRRNEKRQGTSEREMSRRARTASLERPSSAEMTGQVSNVTGRATQKRSGVTVESG